MSGYFPARRAYGVSSRTGIVYIAGLAQPDKALTILYYHASFARCAQSNATAITD
jgi:hypothetical protein